MTNNQRERLYVFLFISGRAPNWVIEWSFPKGTRAKRLKSNLKCGPAEDPSADHILASHAGVFIDFQKNPSSDLTTTSRYFVTSLAVSRPKRLAPFAKKLVRSACSKSNVFGGARISSLPTNGEIRRAPLKTPVWEANFFPAPASLLHSPF